jgi:alkylation response protein AidB-like acyl-CoA dehydrogenase
MDFDPTEDQSQLIAAFDALYAKWSTPELVRSAEPVGFDPELWDQLARIGALEMAVPEVFGGAGASFLDLELVAEHHGRWLAPAPMIESQIAARLLARLKGSAAAELLDSVVAGSTFVTMALQPARDRSLKLVPGGTVADCALALDEDRIVAVPLTGTRHAVENLGSLALADVRIPESTLTLSDGASAAFERAIDEWMTLTAGALAGLARRALEIGVEYAKEREAFGVPIGSFQAVAHPLANSATAIEGAFLLARKAAWSVEGQPERFSQLAPLSFAFATETAREASYRSLHFHGGYGFMMEYDIQLYFRRAKAWAAILMEPRRAYALAAVRRRAAS